jgi:Effector Associated Constant Component 1
MGEETVIRVDFPDLNSANAHEEARSLLSELQQDAKLRRSLNVDKTALARTDKEAQDFGATLVIVLGTPAIIIFANTIKSWAERTGRTTIRLNGVRIENVHSHHVAGILSALRTNAVSQKR